MSDKQVEEAARLVAGTGPICVLTGAGMSADSGIPTFRGPGGLWEKYDPEEFASIRSLERDPEKVWKWHLKLRKLVQKCRPNAGHRALARLEKSLGKDIRVVTQNVDNLHQDAGSGNVIELHGNLWRSRCPECGYKVKDRGVAYKTLPPRCPDCSGPLRMDLVFFGEPLPAPQVKKACAAAENCGLMMVVGTSATVVPAAHLPFIAMRAGADILEFNKHESPLESIAKVSLTGPAEETVYAVINRAMEIRDENSSQR